MTYFILSYGTMNSIERINMVEAWKKGLGRTYMFLELFGTPKRGMTFRTGEGLNRN